MKAFAERNLIVTAVVGIVLVAAVSVAAYYADDLPFIGGGTDYTASFADAANLHTGDDVRIAGVEVGKVESIALSGTHVAVGFRVTDAWVGDRSTVSIDIKTALGQEYLAIDAEGDDAQNPDQTIPLSRTVTPFDVTEALGDLSDTAASINTAQLARSFTVLSQAFAKTPPAVRSALTGLTRLSTTLASQDNQISSLAAQTSTLTGTLQASNAKFAKLINDGATLLQALQARSAAVTQLLQGTRTLSQQLSGLVDDDQKLLGPALDQLGRVTTILNANEGNLTKALKLVGPYYRLLNNAAGNGPWIDIYICGLFTADNAPILDARAKRDCSPKAGSS